MFWSLRVSRGPRFGQAGYSPNLREYQFLTDINKTVTLIPYSERSGGLHSVNVDFASHKAETAVCVTHQGRGTARGDTLFSLCINAHGKISAGTRRRRRRFRAHRQT